MATAGYSGTPLIKKLGLKPSYKVWLIHPPYDYSQWLGEDISGQVCAGREIPDWVHLFAADVAVYHKEMKRIAAAAQKNREIVLWVSWYKKSSGVTTDLTETHVRDYGLQQGLVDIKVCAVSEEWSGLKFVVPVSKR